MSWESAVTWCIRRQMRSAPAVNRTRHVGSVRICHMRAVPLDQVAYKSSRFYLIVACRYPVETTVDFVFFRLQIQRNVQSLPLYKSWLFICFPIQTPNVDSCSQTFASDARKIVQWSR